MIHANQIKPHVPVVGSNNTQLALVDRLVGRANIRLAKDSKGIHHFIPIAWVAFVDDKVHLDRTAEQAKSEWLDFPTTS